MSAEVKKLSPYTILSKWLYDGSRSTKLPLEIVDDKAISNMFLLYFFQSSPYGLMISKLFNNYSLFSLERNEVLYFIKDCVLRSGYKQPYVAKAKIQKDKFSQLLKEKYPFLKIDECQFLVEVIDNSDDKDAVYEMFGFYQPKKKKSTKQDIDKLQKQQKIADESVTLSNIMENFS